MISNEVIDTLTRISRRIRRSRKRKNNVRKTTQRVYDFDRKEEGRKFMDGLTKKYISDDEEVFSSVENRPEYFMAATSLNDHFITKILDARTTAGLNTHQYKETLVADTKAWVNYIRNTFNTKQFQIVEFGTQAGMVIDHDTLGFIDYSTNSNSVEVKIYGDDDFVEKYCSQLTTSFTVATCYIEWVYGGDGSSVNIPLLGEKLPVTEMYPFLEDETVAQYYDRFLDSSASILLLIGPPGTGKTTFIRGLLHHAGKNAIVTYDEKLLDKDYIFARFIEDDADVMVIEDADNFLKSRSDGNSMMHRFLNVGDGLITVRGKKLVFSTNLPSIRDVDPALIRPGRCFDIVNFSHYNPDQAKKLCEKLKMEFHPSEDKKDYSLAEIFHSQKFNKKPETKIGFI